MGVSSDFLVIGSGIAGLTYALRAADRGTVILVTKREREESNTRYAQGGIASVWSESDSYDQHVEDTLLAGAGLCHRDVVELTVREGPARVRELIELGVEFTRRSVERDADYDLTKEGGHSRRRVLHAHDMTGREIARVLLESAAAHPNIVIRDDHVAIDLITRRKIRGLGNRLREDRCLGAYVLDVSRGEVETLTARVTVLSTGGSGKVYLYTSNPDIATGDGVAMARRAGARVGNMEFFQFHPTCLYHPEAKSFLISEAMRGEGGILRRADGTPFMEGSHPLKDLAPRDIVARAIDSELKTTGDDCVFLDMTMHSGDWLSERFPNIVSRVQDFGIDPGSEPIPVVPAAHYQCGGVVTDAHGETSIAGLFACGEVAFTGLHGANRLASNSLLEALVFAHRAAERSLERQSDLIDDSGVEVPDWRTGLATNEDESVVVSQCWDEIRRFMWNYVGIVRSHRRLERAARRLALVWGEIREYYWSYHLTRDLIEVRNIAEVAGLIIASAQTRRESRGLHYTVDHAQTDDRNWCRDTIL